MLTDQDAYHHAKRVLGLLQSDLPDEQLAGARELGVLLAAVPDAWGKLIDTVTVVTTAFARVRPPPPPKPPDTDWKPAEGRMQHCWVRWWRCRALVVRESGARRGKYYPVVDGHYLSAMGGPSTYDSLRDAMKAAEAAAA